MLSKILLSFVLIFASRSTFAAESSIGVINYDLTERFYEAHDGQIVVHVDPTLAHFAETSADGFFSSTQQYAVFGVEYGISSNLSAYADGNYGTSKGEGFSQTGFSTYEIGAKGNLDLDSTNKLTGRIAVSLSPGNQSSTTRYTGYTDYIIALGYQHKIGADTLLGISLSNDFSSKIKDDDSSGQTYTYDGFQDSNLVLTYEKNLSGLKIGGEIGLLHSYSGESFPEFLQAGAYANFAILQNLSVLPKIDYLDKTDAISNKNGLKEYDIVSYSVIVRYAF